MVVPERSHETREAAAGRRSAGPSEDARGRDSGRENSELEDSEPEDTEPSGESRSAGIPEEPAGRPFEAATSELDQGRPVGPTPAVDFWTALYGRRSIRRFSADPVERELVEQIMHAGIWAPSSCNYQMWDLVAVDDADKNAELAALSAQMGNAPVNIVVSYGREFSEEGSANIQSASALIQNMSLAAHVLGLGTFWITQMGDAERVRELVGPPYDRLVIAVLAVGWPKSVPKQGPKRRPLHQVAHWNHYAGRAIPSSAAPEDWPPDLLAIYQRARVLNGLRHNKPRPWEVRALEQALDALVPQGRERAAEGAPRWLDVLPCTGIVTERLGRLRPGFAFDGVERTPEVAAFVAARTRPKAGVFGWPTPDPQHGSPPREQYDVVSCFYRLEDLAPTDRPALLAAMSSWVRPGGSVLIATVNKRSFHDLTERLRKRRGGPRGVEYVLSPDPNIGPFAALDPDELQRLFAGAGLELVARLGLQSVPQPEEIEFRARNFSNRSKRIARGLGGALALLARFPGVEKRRGRFQFFLLRRPAASSSSRGD